MKWQRRLRRTGRRLGFDISRWPTEQLANLRTRALIAQKVDLVLDVGANDGGYGNELRQYGYTNRIVSFEPIHSAFSRLSEVIDASWSVYPYALGNTTSEMAINVAANNEASSSIFPMTPVHEAAAPHATYTRTERITVRRLDDVWTEIGPAKRPFLKLDVQGYEAEVLAGAHDVLQHAIGVLTEMSLVPVYDGSPTWMSILGILEAKGFRLYRVDPGFTDQATGQMLQIDGMFFHPHRASVHI